MSLMWTGEKLSAERLYGESDSKLADRAYATHTCDKLEDNPVGRSRCRLAVGQVARVALVVMASRHGGDAENQCGVSMVKKVHERGLP